MNKMFNRTIFLIILVFLNKNLIFPYLNPFWEKEDKIVYKLHKFIPNTIIFNFSNTLDKTRGITPLGLYYEYSATANFSGALFLNTKFSLGENVPSLKTFDTGIYYRPIKFLGFYTDYKFRNFAIYQIAEHNLVMYVDLLFNFIKYFSATAEVGFDLRFVDLNINDSLTVYKKDWLFYASFKWKNIFMLHPMYLFSVGISIGNISDFELYSFNYWQVEFINYIHLPKGFSIFINGGFGYSGSLPGAGIINKGWVTLGGRYEIKTHL